MFAVEGISPVRGLLPQIDRKVRPLGEVSDFVKEQLPPLLERVRSGTAERPLTQLLTEEVERTLSSVDLRRLLDQLRASGEERLLGVAALDLTMLRTAFKIHGVSVPVQLEQAQQYAAEMLGLPRILNYELIIRSNPPYDTRTFLAGAIGRAERLFYLDHERVERVLGAAVAAVRGALAAVEERDFPGAEGLIVGAARLQRISVTKMRRFFDKRISAEAFAAFRPYLGSIDGEPGPSGLFSPGQHGLRFATFGVGVQSRFDLLESRLKYFPSGSRHQLLAIRDNARAGKSLFGLAMASIPAGDPLSGAVGECYTAPPAVRAAVHRLMSQIAAEMRGHLGMVVRYLDRGAPPAAGSTGTAGMDRSFLQSGIDAVTASCEMLRRTLPAPEGQS